MKTRIVTSTADESGRSVRPTSHCVRFRSSISPTQIVALPSGLFSYEESTVMKVVAR